MELFNQTICLFAHFNFSFVRRGDELLIALFLACLPSPACACLRRLRGRQANGRQVTGRQPSALDTQELPYSVFLERSERLVCCQKPR
jgi:hypothetical protein